MHSRGIVIDRRKAGMNAQEALATLKKAALRKKAIEAAKRIGKVEVDHGETYCKTPDAVPYIEKAFKRMLWP